MLLKHSGLYAVARGLPALVNLLAIVVFSRLLSPEGYGHYALVVAGVGLLGALLFQWLRLCLLRFLPAQHEKPEEILSPILTAFLVLAGLSGLGGVVAFAAVGDPVWRALIVVGVVLVWARGWFDLNAELARSHLAPVRYGLLSGTKALVALALGVVLALAGLGAVGVLLGLLVGLVLAPTVFSRRHWRGVRPAAFQLRRHGYLLAYGLPLAVNFVLVWIVASSDRLLLGWLLDVDAAGLYAVGYDLAQHSLGVVLTVVNLAAYPLVVGALEREGPKAAGVQLQKNGSAILALAVPAAAGLAIMAPELARVFVGAEFRPAAAAVIPWVAAGVLLAGVKGYHFDLAFQLGRRTLSQVWVSLAGATTNLALNILWIPRFGLLGAAYATVCSYGIALALSVWLGRSVFPVPWEWRSLIRVACATGAMTLILLITPAADGLGGVLARVILAAFIYGLVALTLDVGGSQRALVRRVRAGWQP